MVLGSPVCRFPLCQNRQYLHEKAVEQALALANRANSLLGFRILRMLRNWRWSILQTQRGCNCGCMIGWVRLVCKQWRLVGRCSCKHIMFRKIIIQLIRLLMYDLEFITQLLSHI